MLQWITLNTLLMSHLSELHATIEAGGKHRVWFMSFTVLWSNLIQTRVVLWNWFRWKEWDWVVMKYEQWETWHERQVMTQRRVIIFFCDLMLNHNGLKVHKPLCHTKGTVLCIFLSNLLLLLLLFLFSNQGMRIYRPLVVSWYKWYHFFTLFPFLKRKLHTIPPNMWSQGPCTLHTRNI